MAETVSMQVGAAKPTGDADDAVGNVLLLKHPQNHHTGAGLAVVIFSFINCTVVRNTSRPGIMGGLGVFFVGLEAL